MPKKDSHKGKKGFVFEVTAKCEAMVQADRCAAAGCPRLLRPYPPPRLTAQLQPQPTPGRLTRVHVCGSAQCAWGTVRLFLPRSPEDHVRRCAPARSLDAGMLCVGNPRGSSIARERRTTDAPRRAGALPDDDGAVNFEDPLEGMMVTLYKVSGAFVLWRHPCAIAERKFHDSVHHLSVHPGQEEDGVRGEGVQV
jgi:hypothetical protein